MRKTTVACSLIALLSAGVLAQDGGKRPSREEMQRMRQRMMQDDGAPKIGQLAPGISLKTFDGKGSFDLAANLDKRPVILFFGSYT